MRGKIYFAMYLIKVNIVSLFCKIIFHTFGASIGRNTKFANKPEVCGYISNIEMKDNCYIDKNVSFIVNKEGKIFIDQNTLISYNVIINAGTGNVRIGKNTMIAANTYIINNDHNINDTISVRDSNHITKDVCIEDNVWIGANCVILKGVKIGEGSVIGAGSIVTKDIPAYSIAYGNPCVVRKEREFNKE